MYPQLGNNANLIGKLIPYFRKAGHEVRLLSDAFGLSEDVLPEQLFGVKVHWVTGCRMLVKRLAYTVTSRLKNDPGYTGEVGAGIMADAAVLLHKQYPYDLVLATMQPYHLAIAASRLRDCKKIVYLMDPPDEVIDNLPWKAGQKQLMPSLQRMDKIFTTPFIQEAIKHHDHYHLAKKLVPVGFPHIEERKLQPDKGDLIFDLGKINLLFCGALFPDVRSPEFFLKILEGLDGRFTLTFMGRNCPEFWKEYSVNTKAEVRVFPPLPYGVAINAMHHADILINIGNNMLVHMPSKTLDYINTGKPIVNFHKFEDCPTLFYTKRYPCCLNLLEPGMNINDATEIFIDFCIRQKGREVPRSEIKRLYYDCSAEEIAKEILQSVYCMFAEKEREAL